MGLGKKLKSLRRKLGQKLQRKRRVGIKPQVVQVKPRGEYGVLPRRDREHYLRLLREEQKEDVTRRPRRLAKKPMIRGNTIMDMSKRAERRRRGLERR